MIYFRINQCFFLVVLCVCLLHWQAENTFDATSEDAHPQLFLRSNSLQRSGKAKMQTGAAPGLQWTRSLCCGLPSPRQTITNAHSQRIQSFKNLIHKDTIFTLHLKIHVLRLMCTHQQKTTTHRHASRIITNTQMNKQTKTTNKQQINTMAATETADHIVALPLSPSPGGGSRNRRREGFRERECVCGWEPTLNSKQKTKKRNPKYQNMSEWIITIPRHRGMEWEEGRSRRKDGGQECWNELKRRVRADVPLSYLSIVWKKCLHMGTESTQTYTDKDSNYSFCLSHTQNTHSSTVQQYLSPSLRNILLLFHTTSLSIPSHGPH